MSGAAQRLAGSLGLALLAACNAGPGHADQTEKREERVFFACTLNQGARSVRLDLDEKGELVLSAPPLRVTSDLAGTIMTGSGEDDAKEPMFHRSAGLVSIAGSQIHEVWIAGRRDGTGGLSGGFRLIDAGEPIEDLGCDPDTLHADWERLQLLVNVAQLSP